MGSFVSFPGFWAWIWAIWTISGVLTMDFIHPWAISGVLGMYFWPNWDLFWVIPKVLGMDLGLLGIDHFGIFWAISGVLGVDFRHGVGYPCVYFRELWLYGKLSNSSHISSSKKKYNRFEK